MDSHKRDTLRLHPHSPVVPAAPKTGNPRRPAPSSPPMKGTDTWSTGSAGYKAKKEGIDTVSTATAGQAKLGDDLETASTRSLKNEPIDHDASKLPAREDKKAIRSSVMPQLPDDHYATLQYLIACSKCNEKTDVYKLDPNSLPHPEHTPVVQRLKAIRASKRASHSPSKKSGKSPRSSPRKSPRKSPRSSPKKHRSKSPAARHHHHAHHHQERQPYRKWKDHELPSHKSDCEHHEATRPMAEAYAKLETARERHHVKRPSYDNGQYNDDAASKLGFYHDTDPKRNRADHMPKEPAPPHATSSEKAHNRQTYLIEDHLTG